MFCLARFGLVCFIGEARAIISDGLCDVGVCEYSQQSEMLREKIHGSIQFGVLCCLCVQRTYACMIYIYLYCVFIAVVNLLSLDR